MMKPAFLFYAIVSLSAWQLNAQTLNWQRINSPNGGNLGANVIAASETILFMATDSGMWRTSDDGNSWTSINKGIKPHVATLTVKGTELFAGTDSGLYYSPNN